MFLNTGEISSEKRASSGVDGKMMTPARIAETLSINI